MKNKPFLLAIFLYFILLIIALYVSWVYYQDNVRQVEIETQSALALEVDIKKTLMDKKLSTTETEILFLAGTGRLKLALDTLKTSWAELGSNVSKHLYALYVKNNSHKQKSKLINAKSGSNYDMLHETLHTLLYELKQKSHYKNILLLDMQGNVIYDVEKGSYFTSNIRHKNINLSKVFEEVVKSKTHEKQEQVMYRDFSTNDGSFFVTVIADEKGEKIGVLAFEIDQKIINKIAKLKAVEKNNCIEKSTKKENTFLSTACLNYQDNYWLIQSEAEMDKILSPIKEASLKHIVLMFGIGFLALFFGYTILARFLGKGEEDE